MHFQRLYLVLPNTSFDCLNFLCGGSAMRPSLIEGECVENILPNGRCYADVMTKMRRAVLTIPRDSPRSPFSISPQ